MPAPSLREMLAMDWDGMLDAIDGLANGRGGAQAALAGAHAPQAGAVGVGWCWAGHGLAISAVVRDDADEITSGRTNPPLSASHGASGRAQGGILRFCRDACL